jgi:ribA/ribD-fused uncharacterized protein
MWQMTNHHTPEAGFDAGREFCSNFHPSPITVTFADGSVLRGPTVEHVYQAAKCAEADHRTAVLAAPTPGAAKRLGRRSVQVPGWDQMRVDVMRRCLHAKFSDPELADALAATAPMTLVEFNVWHDVFWGRCTGGCHQPHPPTGENQLGRLLVALRDRC